MKTKQILIGAGVAAVLLGTLLGIYAHSRSTAPAPGGELLGEIGTPFEQIQSRPGMEYQSVDIPDASGQCMGSAKSDVRYFFFGTQGLPALEELSPEYQEQLKCAGIVCTVGDVYPQMKEKISLEELCSALGVAEYTYTPESEDAPDQGWAWLLWKDYVVWIDATGESAEPDDAGSVSIGRGDLILILDEELEKENLSVQHQYWNEHSEAER